MDGITQILPVTKVKRTLLDLLRRMEEDDATIALTRNGEAVGVMMTPTHYEALMETIDILSDRGVMQALAESEKDYAEGRVVSHKEVWQETNV